MGYSMNQSFISGQPPLLVFTICLTAFGLTMVVLAYVVGEQEVPNPDVQMDWNKLFKKISDYKLCPLQNHTKLIKYGPFSGRNRHSSESVFNSSHIVDESKSMSAVLSDVVDHASDEQLDKSAFVDISVQVQFGLLQKVTPDTVFQLMGQIKGKLLGFSGKYSSHVFNISLSFRSLNNNSCGGEKCQSVWDVCLMMNLPSDLFLPEVKSPETCKNGDLMSHEIQVISFVNSESLHQKNSLVPCMELHYTPDAKLIEMLSPHDRSIVNLHLMHTSYFMFVMVMTLVCYSLIKGRYRHPKASLSMEKIPLDA